MKQYAEFLQPKEIVIDDQDGIARTFIISKFDAIEGRELVTQYGVTAAPKIGEYKTNEALMLRVMAHVAVPAEPAPLPLSTKALVNNHTGDYETLMKLEYAVFEYNCSFLRAGKLSNYLELVGEKARELIAKTLTQYSQQSSASDKPH